MVAVNFPIATSITSIENFLYRHRIEWLKTYRCETHVTVLLDDENHFRFRLLFGDDHVSAYHSETKTYMEKINETLKQKIVDKEQVLKQLKEIMKNA
jgi:hypothetical protein